MDNVRNFNSTRSIIIVPAYNESSIIGGVVGEIVNYTSNTDVLVVDDGSEDNSASHARLAGAKVIELPHNLGIGGAVQAGYRFVVEMGYDFVVRMDGDGQHNPIYLKDLIDPIKSGEADVVIGSRYLTGEGYHATGIRAIGVRLFASLVSVAVGQRFTDTTSGFRAANRQAASFLARYLPADYPEIEGLVMLCRAGFRVVEVPVSMRPRTTGVSSITKLLSVYYVVKVVLAVLIEMVRRPHQMGGAD